MFQRVLDPHEKIATNATLLDLDNEDPEDEEPTLKQITSLIRSDDWENYRFHQTIESLINDLAQKTADLAAVYGSHEDGPAFPFKPLTELGREHLSKLESPMNIGASPTTSTMTIRSRRCFTN